MKSEEETIFFCSAIYNKFSLEFEKSDCITWQEFINKKDLGVVLNNSKGYSWAWDYKIIDQKKWDYNRIKYEF